MIISPTETVTDVRHEMRGGKGDVVLHVAKPDGGLPDHARLIGEIHLAPGTSIGIHTHEGECEVFYILEGRGVYHDNGQARAVKPGDICICPSGECHGIANQEDTLLRVFATIIQK